MTTIREFYRNEVESQWTGVTVPELTPEEAVRAGKKLWGVAVRQLPRPGWKPVWKSSVKLTSGRNYSYIRGGVLRLNPQRGWKHLIHELSHSFYRRLRPYDKPHDRPHGALERSMIQYAISHGWLEGTLKPKVKVKAKPTKVDERAKKYAATCEGILRWEAKARRAENALKKLRRRKSALARYMGANG